MSNILPNGSTQIPATQVTQPGAFCVWLMGLSASGKTTLAQLLAEALRKRGIQVEVLDGDVLRSTVSQGLGFSRGDRETNLRRIALMAQDLIRQQIVPIVAAICPYHEIRKEVRSMVGEFVEVYLNCSLEVCISRDPKGLYRRALAGDIQCFTGIDDAFEPPRQPDIEVTTGAEHPEASLARIIEGLEGLRRLPPNRADSTGDDDSGALKLHRPLGLARR
jgi:adenylyl-sulfate kinase